MLCNIIQNTKEHGAGVLGPNWKGLYQLAKQVQVATYRLEELDGTSIKHPWNADHFAKLSVKVNSCVLCNISLGVLC